MFENLFRLDGKVAVVTGAGNGLGRSFALGLAAFGATVICADRNLEGADETASLAKQSRGKAEAVPCRCRRRGLRRRRCGRRSPTIIGRIDILVNNAGINTNSMRTHEYSVADWDRLMAINLRGVFLNTRKALALMLPGPGSIINISVDPRPARLLAGLARRLDQLFGGQGRRHRLHPPGRRRIRRGENPLSTPSRPAGTAAPRSAPSGARHPAPRTSRQFEQAIHARIPMKHRGVPDDLVGLVVYLASDASHYVTGQVIAHDGGWDGVVA